MDGWIEKQTQKNFNKNGKKVM